MYVSGWRNEGMMKRKLVIEIPKRRIKYRVDYSLIYKLNYRPIEQTIE